MGTLYWPVLTRNSNRANSIEKRTSFFFFPYSLLEWALTGSQLTQGSIKEYR